MDSGLAARASPRNDGAGRAKVAAGEAVALQPFLIMIII
jgi:hypothetical protein